MLAHDGYGTRYQKIKSSKRHSISPSHHHKQQTISPIKPNPDQTVDHQLGRVVGKLTDRVDGLEIKIVSITNIVKLLQKYSETKDEQYQKQKQNQEFRKSIGQRVCTIQSYQIETKLKQFENLSQRVKSQITAMESLRVGLSRDNSKKTMYSPQPFKTMQSPNATVEKQTVVAEIQDSLVQLESAMREEINKKMDICFNYLKNMKHNLNQNNNNPTAVNSIMLQQQMHNLTLTVNKVEGDCLRNKMIFEKKIQELASHIVSNRSPMRNKNQDDSIVIRRSSDYYGEQSRSRSKTNKTNLKKKSSNKNNMDESRSQNSSISKRSKSKSKRKETKIKNGHHNQGIKSQQVIRIVEQKKVKQNELKQALRKKKDNQEKLRMKK